MKFRPNYFFCVIVLQENCTALILNHSKFRNFPEIIHVKSDYEDFTAYPGSAINAKICNNFPISVLEVLLNSILGEI